MVGAAGSPGFQWVTYYLRLNVGFFELYVEKPDGSHLLIDDFNSISTGGTTGGNIGLIYADYFNSVTDRPDLTFGIIDNVIVSDFVALVPEPGTFALILIGFSFGLGRRRCR